MGRMMTNKRKKGRAVQKGERCVRAFLKTQHKTFPISSFVCSACGVRKAWGR